MKEGIILEMLRRKMETVTDVQGSRGQRPALLCFWKSLQHLHTKCAGCQPLPVPGLPQPLCQTAVAGPEESCHTEILTENQEKDH